MSLAAWWWLERTWQGLGQALTTAAGGCLVEMTLSDAGLVLRVAPGVTLGAALRNLGQ